MHISIDSGNGLTPFGAKPLHEPRFTYYQSNLKELFRNFGEIRIEVQNVSVMKRHLKMSFAKMAAILSSRRLVNHLHLPERFVTLVITKCCDVL